MKTKVCSKCKVEKSLDKFYVIKGIQNHGCLRSECKECGKKYGKRKPDLVEEPERPVRHAWESLGAEWHSHQVYDPFNAANRYGGART